VQVARPQPDHGAPNGGARQRPEPLAPPHAEAPPPKPPHANPPPKPEHANPPPKKEDDRRPD
jgi:hypothetical protein